jgi:hypothetical protein
MHKHRQIFEVNGVRVARIRHGAAEHWECERCKAVCEHIVTAVTWMRTRKSAGAESATKLH